ncbi:MAG: polar amino acid transport system substrate-binding protein, partial [Subtercola sp.]|nr:polar amino acid transport system substrate-binding protein [Subtercola sp.]
KSTDKMVVLAGNPDNLDPADPCGISFASVTGGIEVQEISEMGPVCAAAGKEAPTQVTLPDAPSEQQALITGRVQAILYDPAGAEYVSKQNGDKLEVLPGLVPGVNQTPAGWAFPKGGSPVQTAVLAAIDELIADGTWGQILSDAGLSDLAIVPPTVDGLPQQ